MVPGIGGGELVLIAVVALVVVGPKDLPKLLRQLGRFVGKMRRMADEFRTSFEDMARQSELDELRKEVDALRAGKLGLEDVGHQMKALESDINSSLNAPVSTPEGAVSVEAEPANPQLANPQLANPQLANPQLANPQLANPQLANPQLANPQLEGLPPAEKPETVAKPKRVRKPKAAITPEPVVAPVKRVRAKKSAT